MANWFSKWFRRGKPPEEVASAQPQAAGEGDQPASTPGVPERGAAAQALRAPAAAAGPPAAEPPAPALA
ncbi:MAG: hypothetical protein NFV71_13630, partial [Candidatus Accumulibacter sp.]|nr:hypothetical protein [Accumulibacter sp.]MDS4050516.1 hypothetical protein [Accumulibacter sp.]